jgi:hypothetical protein
MTQVYQLLCLSPSLRRRRHSLCQLLCLTLGLFLLRDNDALPVALSVITVTSQEKLFSLFRDEATLLVALLVGLVVALLVALLVGLVVALLGNLWVARSLGRLH